MTSPTRLVLDTLSKCWEFAHALVDDVLPSFTTKLSDLVPSDSPLYSLVELLVPWATELTLFDLLISSAVIVLVLIPLIKGLKNLILPT